MNIQFGFLKRSLALLALVTVLGAGAPTQVPAAGLTWTALNLINGWHAYNGTRLPAYAIDSDNFVHLRGGMSTGGTNQAPFTLPVGFRPNHDVYIPANTVNGTTGRLDIHADGTVYVEAAPDVANAFNFTSLEGISFSLK
jgi:hypothetical protein